MLIKKLNAEDMEDVSTKSIYCLGFSIDYLQGLCDKYNLLEQIKFIIDDNTRNQGVKIFRNKEIPVYSSDFLNDVDFKDAIILITSDYHGDEFEKLQVISNVTKHFEIIYYFASQETEYEDEYRNKYKACPLENIILFRSGPHQSSYVKGMDFTDNSRALYEYMLENNYNKKYELAWIVKNPKDFDKYKNIENVTFVSFDWSVSENEEERSEYYRVLCLAKNIFFTDAYGFARNSRRDQVRIQLWHGCGFKTRVNFVRCEKRYEYTTVISELYSKIHQEIFGLRADQMLVTGYAKQDWLFEPLNNFVSRLSLPKADKYIFWLPTFRVAQSGLPELNEYELKNQIGLPIVDTFEKISQLNSLLQSRNSILVIKLHPFQDKTKISNVNMSNIVLLDTQKLFDEDIQINQILGCADALISDYSSAAIDYMLLDRPIAFTLDDVEEYSNSRGFLFENVKEWLAGKEIYDFRDFCEFIQSVCDEKDTEKVKRGMLLKKMHKFRDNQSRKRILESLDITM